MQTTNVLVAIKNIIEGQSIKHFTEGDQNPCDKVNNIGEHLEDFIFHAFCNSLEELESKKYDLYSKFFSWCSYSPFCPPSAILKGSDVIDVKKVELGSTSIKFNGAYPRSKFYKDDTDITSDCRDCEIWDKKDLLYAICTTQGNNLKRLWFVYGDCYFASKEFYQKALKITDPLNVAEFNFLDNRGLYGNRASVLLPSSLIDKTHYNTTDNIINALMLKRKYESFPLSARLALENLVGDRLSIVDCEIQSPNYASLKLQAKLIQYH
ncbi:MAG: NgoPII family restriction endonuclease [Betaproteobacteria bacterium]